MGEAFFLRESRDAKHHGWDEGDPIDAVAFDQLKKMRGLEAFHQDHGGSAEERLETGTEGGCVVERAGYQCYVPGVEEGGYLGGIVCRLGGGDDELGLSCASTGGQGSLVGRNAFG